MTFRLKEAAEILGLNFLDHLIFSGEGFFSYSRGGLIKAAPGFSAGMAE
ncbi:MAG: hypothetical protein LBK83_11130 [Treponema sp.]|nr:hypothetical protein [Treponema sp.]